MAVGLGAAATLSVAGSGGAGGVAGLPRLAAKVAGAVLRLAALAALAAVPVVGGLFGSLGLLPAASAPGSGGASGGPSVAAVAESANGTSGGIVGSQRGRDREAKRRPILPASDIGDAEMRRIISQVESTFSFVSPSPSLPAGGTEKLSYQVGAVDVCSMLADGPFMHPTRLVDVGMSLLDRTPSPTFPHLHPPSPYLRPQVVIDRRDGAVAGCTPMDRNSATAYERLMPLSSSLGKRAVALGDGNASAVLRSGLVVLRLDLMTPASSKAASSSKSSMVVRVRPWCDRDSVDSWVAKVWGVGCGQGLQQCQATDAEKWISIRPYPVVATNWACMNLSNTS